MSSSNSRSTPVRSKRALPLVTALDSKVVKFNPQTVETSFGGTQTPGKINVDVSLSINLPESPRKPPSKLVKKTSPVKFTPKRKSSTLAPSSATKKRSTSPATVSKEKSPRSTVLSTNQQNMATPSSKQGIRKFVLDRISSTPDCFNPVTMETPVPKKELTRRSASLINFADEDSCSVSVAVRVRPFSEKEVSDENVKRIVSMNGCETIVTSETGLTNRFTYDFSFWSFDKLRGEFADQEHVYNMLAQPMLGKAFEGYNTCLFAYGQTGSGKSYSIMGHGEERGIVPRFTEEIFQRVESSTEENVKVNVEISFFEIYNEKIHDLLTSSPKEHSDKKAPLKVREHPALGPYVEGLSSYVVRSFEDIQSWLNLGNKQRATASTGMNDKSSRSHSVFTVLLTQTRTEVLEGEDHEHSTTSRINLVDLAGSERQTLAQTSGQRLKEGASINKSLHALGKVISLLSEQTDAANKKKKLFIPYRDSVLTWLLKESLGGNSKTTMLATVSPSNVHTEETLSTLRYARQARSIVNMAKVNEDPKAKIIRELRAEIEKLRSGGGILNESDSVAGLAEVESLREMLKLKELEMQEVTRTWQEKLQRSEAKKLEESMLMEKSGVTFKIDNRLPNLVNLNEDPQLSEMLLYVLKEGETTVGRMRPNSPHEIQLLGALIADRHCLIANYKDKVTVTPVGDAPTYVNGEQVVNTITLHHGDRVILGGDHYFRFNHPKHVQNSRKVSTHMKDFDFARSELIEAQNARIQAELEEARRAAQLEMQAEVERTKQAAAHELSMQRHGYEDKLAEMEKALSEQNKQKLRSEVNRQKAEEDISKLFQQKTRLEQEVLANRKKLELEAKASQKAVDKSRIDHSRFLKQLEIEQQKIKNDVQKLSTIKQRRANTPVTIKKDTAKTDLYRTQLLVREANKISQHLKKFTTFSREDVSDDSGCQILIKVTNSKLGISTFWTLRKFEDKLVQMRELYQGENADSTLAEEIFYDPNDSWERDDRINSTADSPRLRRQQLHRLSDLESRSRRLSSLEGVKGSPLASISSAKAPRRVMFQTESSVMSEEYTRVPVIGLCRDFVVLALDRFKEMTVKESLADRILYNCDCLKMAVVTLLDAYEQASLNKKDKAVFIDSEVVHVSSLQIMTSLELVLTHCSLWASSYENMGSTLVHDMTSKIMYTVRKLGNQLIHFMQGAENDIETMVKESSAAILDSVFAICRHCGEVALATNTFMRNLSDTFDSTLMEEEEEFEGIKLGHDVRQEFLSGCDTFIDKTLLGGLKTIEECETKVQNLSAEWSTLSLVSEDMLKHMEIVTATTKIMLLKCQEIQVELDSTLREGSMEKAENFYHRNYCRSQRLISQVKNLVDNVSLLTQAAQPLVRGQDGDLRQLCKCAEMIQKSTTKLLAVSDVNVATDSSQSESSEFSVLSDSQNEQLDIAGQEVRLATKALIAMIKKNIGTKTSTPTKGRRLLPASPSEKGLRSSPKIHKQKHAIQQNTSLVDLYSGKH